jgi:AbrB family looped-hinge helix DNA binding protein
MGYEMTATATLSGKFQISIPKTVREAQHWEAGQEFVFIPKGKGVLVMPVPDLEDLVGIAKGARKTDYRDRKDRY